MSKKIFLFLLATLILPSVHLAEAQQAAKVHKIGVLWSVSPSSSSPRMEVFRQGLRELGYVEGQNLAIEQRSTAAELVQAKVEVILTAGTNPTQAAKTATSTIPVVMTFVSDPIGAGFVSSLARPGGNITGLTNLGPELSTKWLELLKEMAPKASRVGVLFDPAVPAFGLLLKEMQGTAKALALELQPVEVRNANALDGALATFKKGRPNTLIVLLAPRTMDHQKRIVEFAVAQRLPAMYHWREYVDAGGLAYYGASVHEMYRRAATYVDKILKGTKPADLPVEQPTKFEFVINLKTAKQLRLTIPPNVLARADKVIK